MPESPVVSKEGDGRSRRHQCGLEQPEPVVYDA
jgi:hypothetical protein